MKLYHFTTADRVGSILEKGLRANPLMFGDCETIEGLKRQRGVWLTELDNMHMTADECKAHFKKSGEWRRYWLHDETDKLVRITIRIGDNDQRLIRFDSKQPEFARIYQRTWLYLRTVTPNKITDINRVVWSRPNEKETRAIAA
jgi:hypothetical protein